MRCNEARSWFEDGERAQMPASVREHLRTCPACQADGQDWRLVGTGFRMLSQEPVPTASTGFVARLARRLAETSLARRAATQYWDLVGRRVILVGTLLTLTVVMALMLPPSGPWRSPTALDLSLLQAEVTAENDPVLPDDPGSSQSSVPNVQAGEDRKGR
jgi:predicted anti-sigma-YlaC factor YlaD